MNQFSNLKPNMPGEDLAGSTTSFEVVTPAYAEEVADGVRGPFWKRAKHPLYLSIPCSPKTP